MSRIFRAAPIAAGLLLASGPVWPEDGTPKVAFHFSDGDHIDRLRFDRRDPDKPFFFAMTLPTLGAQQFTVDKGSVFDVWLDSKVPPGELAQPTARSLALTLGSDLDVNVKDKVFLNAVRLQTPDPLNARESDNERFISFDLMLDRTYQAPKYWVIHFQVLQCCSGHPPLTIKVIPEQSDAGAIAMELTIANDPSEAAAFGKAVRIAAFKVARETWTHVALDMKPSPCGGGDTGKVVAWVDHAELANWRGCWGYRSSAASPSERGLINANMSIDLGIYRRRQPNRQTVYFDNILYGRTRADVEF